jgi:quinol monooxygenase YgiN
MIDHVAWLLELAVKPGQLEDVKVLMADLVESAEAEPGTLIYEFAISEDGSVIHTYERFTDSDAALTHLTTFGEKFVQRFLAAFDPTRVVVYGTPSDEVKQAASAFQPIYMAPLGGFAR